MEESSLPCPMQYIWHKELANQCQEPTSKCYTGAYSCSLYKHVTHSWNQYGQFSERQWHWRPFIRHSMGHSLYLPYSTQSLTRCSNIWTRHALQHSVHSWVEENWRTQAMTNWSKIPSKKTKAGLIMMIKLVKIVLIRNDGILCKARGCSPRVPTNLFFKRFFWECTLPKIKILGGEMAKPRTCFEAKIGPCQFMDFAPPSMLINSSAKLARLWEDIRILPH